MMYHHVNSDRCSNNIKIFESHMKYISQNYTTVFPTLEKLPRNSICLVFDDGYYDFYKYIFPIVKRYKLKVLLGVVPKYTLDSIDISDDKRLNYEHNDLFKYFKNGTFCTYEELKEMIDSGYIQVASHSYSHINLLEENIDLKQELKSSKDILENKLNICVESFIFPFGKYSQYILDETKKYYKYPFRIGNGIDKDFNGTNGVIYRIDGDNLENEKDIFRFSNIIKFKFKTFIKSIVGNR